MSRIARVRVDQSGSPVYAEAQPVDDGGLRVPLTAFQRNRATWDEYVAWVNKQPGSEFVAPGITWAQWSEDLHTYSAVYQREFAGKLADATCPQVSSEATEITTVESVDLRGFSPPIDKPYHEWTASVRRKANLAALALLRKIEADERSATEAERATLRWFSGWGGLRPQDLPLDPAIFDQDYLDAIAEWKKVEEARKRGTMYVPRSNLFEGILQQFFTPMPLAEGMWRLIARSGVESLSVESILEPSAGSGRLIEAKGDRYEHVPVQLVEMDPLLQRIEAAVYPNASRWAGPFETFASSARKFRAVYDIIIGNPPYPVRSRTDVAMDPAGESWKRASTYFEAMALSLSGPGTVICLLNPIGHITATSTTSEQRRLRRLMLQRCQLVTAVAPPSDVFPGADLNLAIYMYVVLPKHMWGEDRLNDPEIRAILEGRYFEIHPENVIGSWTEVSSKFGKEIKVRGSITVEDFDRVTVNPISSDVLDAIRDARTDEAVAEARKTAASGFNDAASGVVQSVGERAAAISAAMGLAAAEADSVVYYDDILKTSARMLADRVGNWLDRLASHREWANRARLELFLDVADMAHTVNVWADPRVAGPEYDQLRRVIERDGTVHEILATGASPRVVAPRVENVADAIRWYSQRYGLCAHTDLVRHGYTEEDGINAVLADATLMFEWQSEGVRFYRWDDFLSGDLWARIDTIDATLSDSADRDPLVVARLSDARVAVMAEVSPLPMAQITVTPRDSIIPLEVKEAFVNWWVYRAPVPQRLEPGRVVPGNIGDKDEIHRQDPTDPDVASELGRAGSGAFALRLTYASGLYRLAPAVGSASLTEFFRLDKKLSWDNYAPARKAQAQRAEFMFGYLNGLSSLKQGILDPAKGVKSVYDRTTPEPRIPSGEDKKKLQAESAETGVPLPDPAVIREEEDTTVAKLFSEWISTLPDYAKQVESAYNRAYRGIGKVRAYSEDPIPFARVAPGFALRAYQNAGVRRLNERGGGILAFTVGLGKTFSGGSTIALGRQEGTIRRPVVVVPDSVSVNWRNEMLVMLPEYRTCLMGATQVIKRDTKGNIIDASRYRMDTKPERVAKWRAFKDGLYDLLIVRFTHFLNDVAMYDDTILPIIQNDVILAQVGALNEDAAAVIQEKLDALDVKLRKARKDLAEARYQSDVTAAREKETKILEEIKKLSASKRGLTNSVVERVRQSIEEISTDKPFRPNYKATPVKRSMTREEMLDLAEEVGVGDALTADMTNDDIFTTLSDVLSEGASSGPFPNIAYFEDLGIDYIVVDEAHNFKNLYSPKAGHAGTIEFLPTSEDPMGGSPTIRAWDLYLKTQYLLANNNDRGVTLLTGTPVKNSPIEIYNLLRFVSRKVWEQRAIASPTEFVRRFLQIDVDFTRDAGGMMREQSTLRGWNPTTFPDLQAIFRVFLERRSQADLEEVKRKEGQSALEEFRRSFPEAIPHDIKFDLDPIQERFFEPIRACIAAATEFDTETCTIRAVAKNSDAQAEIGERYGVDMQELTRLLQPIGLFEEDGSSEQDDKEPIDQLLVVELFTKATLDIRLLDLELRLLEGRAPSSKKDSLETRKAKLDAIRAKNRGKGIVALDTFKSGTPEYFEHMAKPEVKSEMAASRDVRTTNRKIDILRLLRVSELAEMYTGRVVPARYLELARRIKENPSCGHVVFCDISTVIPAIRQTISDIAGIPLNRIGAIIGSDAVDFNGRKLKGTPGAMRQAIADAFNGSDARRRPDGGQDEARDPGLSVVIGTTGAMGEGINLQRRTCAVHHMDIPWEPASLEQRNGRGARQGNQIGTVNLYYYLQRGSFDGFKRNKVEGKQSWMTALWLGMSGDLVDPSESSGGGKDRIAEIVELIYYKEDEVTQAKKAKILECFKRMKENARAAAAREAVITGWQQATSLWALYRFTVASLVGRDNLSTRDQNDLESRRDAAIRATNMLRSNPLFTRTDLLDLLEQEPVVWEPDTDRVLRIGDWIRVRAYKAKEIYVVGKGKVLAREAGEPEPKSGDLLVVDGVSRDGHLLTRPIGTFSVNTGMFPPSVERSLALKYEVVWEPAEDQSDADAKKRAVTLRAGSMRSDFPGWHKIPRAIRTATLDDMWRVITEGQQLLPVWWSTGASRNNAGDLFIPLRQRDTDHIHLMPIRAPRGPNAHLIRSDEQRIPEGLIEQIAAGYAGVMDPSDVWRLRDGIQNDTIRVLSVAAGIEAYDRVRYVNYIPWLRTLGVTPLEDATLQEIIRRPGGLSIFQDSEFVTLTREAQGLARLASVWYPYGIPPKVAFKTAWDARRRARGEVVEPEGNPDAPTLQGSFWKPGASHVAHVDQHARFREPEPAGDAPLFIRRR